PFVTSGIRIGTPAITTRGFKDAECDKLAGWIADILDNPEDEATVSRVKGEVLGL
ncbi:MAG: serine hydroxymethyltransferase, partial [Gammaproteobacteria bacterium]|nr:serine hydroxymethyltransferase [Gammaproteobacteria bacterium]